MYKDLFFKSDREGSLRKFPVRHTYSLRMAGNMADTYEKRKGAAAQNRLQFLRKAGFQDHKIIRSIPQNSVEIVSVNSKDEGKEIKCDGLFTMDPKVALAMCVGDCPPVIITTLQRDFLMPLHVGMKGAAEGIVRRAMQLIKGEYIIPSERLLVGIGPGICARCYDAQWVIEKYGKQEAWQNFLPRDERDGKQHCDLRGYIVHEFRKFGVKEKNLFIAKECTCCSRYPDRSYLLASHHRAKTSGPEERFLAVAALARPVFSLRRLFGRSFFTAQS